MKNILKLHKRFEPLCVFVCDFAGRTELFLALPRDQGTATLRVFLGAAKPPSLPDTFDNYNLHR